MTRKLKILDFDVECLPGHWIGGDYVSKIITAVGWCWVGKRDVKVWTHYDLSPSEMSEMLANQIVQADLVTGHYIRGFDLSLVNGMQLRSNREPLPPVLSSDTKLDLYKAHGRSKSQRNLAADLGVSAPKIDVTLRDWEDFNLRERGARRHGVARVRGDVIQHMEMRERLLEIGWLGPPRRWEPRSKGSGYRA